MAEEKRRRQGKKNRKFGRNRVGHYRCGPSVEKYVRTNRRFWNKLARVERFNGKAAAASYQSKYAGKVHEPKKLVR